MIIDQTMIRSSHDEQHCLIGYITRLTAFCGILYILANVAGQNFVPCTLFTYCIVHCILTAGLVAC